MPEIYRPSKPYRPLEIHERPGSCVYADELTGELCGVPFPPESPRNRKYCDRHKKIVDSRKAKKK